MSTNDPLAHAADLYRRALPPGGRLLEFPLTGLDRLDVPVWALSLFNATDSGLWGICEGVGYGETDPQARVGALGELTEEVCSSRAVSGLKRETGSYREMVALHTPDGVVDPVTLCLDAGSPYTPDAPLEWVETRRLATGETVRVPIEFVACALYDLGEKPGVARLVTPVTNGHGAGTTREMAITHGLLELLQRDGNSVRYRALAGNTAVDLATITDLAARALLDRYDAAGVEIVVKCAATDFGMVNLYVVGADRVPVPGALPVMAAACGEAVHPNRDVALRKALLEFASSRARLALFHGPLDTVRRHTPPGYLNGYLSGIELDGEEHRGLRGMRRWLGLDLAGMKRELARVLRVERTIPFTDLPTDDDPALTGPDKGALLRHVVDRLRAEGFGEMLVADLWTDGAVHAVKVIVPGLEVETMSYGRIGERNVRRLRKHARATGEAPIVSVGEEGNVSPGALPVALTDAARARLGGPAFLDPATWGRAAGDLFVLYREPGRHAARVALGEKTP